MERYLALELASTIRHDGDGGVADDLADERGAQRWIHAVGEGDFTDTESVRAARSELVALRQAVRALFARAVSPAPPSPADAGRLLPVDEALARLNTAAAREPIAPQLAWADGEFPTTRLLTTEPDPLVRLTAALARDAIDFLAGPERDRLRACTAPRCVRYYLKRHGRQEWCKPSCGNRARVARHYERQHGTE
ncbi:CGNR zinc finger domain-containing protein [Streptomyces sp. NPDC021093]|uniref:CGNR zinc finger domain-containing protein n=1 Tax=Streptomyces sp. NPDC021093 TaxID=3365112 RepID=UPI00378F034E